MSNQKRKSWKSYFLDFFMLFLAVSFGFLADNYREKISERTKEKEYIQSMMEDVTADRKNLEVLIQKNTERIQGLDALKVKCFKSKLSNEDKEELYQNLVHLILHPEFITPSELTMQQLKNAGGMRLIKSKEAINAIIRYDSEAKKLANQQQYYENYQNKAIAVGTEVFNFQQLVSKVMNSNPVAAKDLEFVNTSLEKRKEFGNSVIMYQGIINYYLTLLKDMDAQGSFLIKTLQASYEL